MSDPILRYREFDKTFFIMTDASGTALASAKDLDIKVELKEDKRFCYFL